MSDESAPGVTSTTADSAAPPGFGKWGAGLSISQTKLDTTEDINYEGDVFVRRNQVVGGPRPDQGTALTKNEMRSLHTELEHQLRQEPANAQKGPLKVFIEVLKRAIGN